MIRVVIFEDNDELRHNLASFLSLDEEMEVVGHFSNVLQVEQQVTDCQPDVVLMDIDMPGASGIEGIQRLRRVNQSAQVMMLTVFEDEDSIFAALQAGANGYLLKKTPPARILEAIRELHGGGGPMSGVIARKVLGHFRPAAPQAGESLTDREKQILDLLVKGQSYKMIAAELSITANTVRNHIHNIYEKLHVSSATEAAFKMLGK